MGSERRTCDNCFDEGLGIMTLNHAQGAIFDMDGVLVDTLPLHERSWFALGKERALYIDRELFEKGNGLRTVSHILSVLKWTTSQEEAEQLALAKEAIYVQHVVQEGVGPVPGALSFLKRLREMGIRCAVGTSAPRSHLDLVLKTAGLEGFFETVITAEDVKEGKPNPEVFLKAAQGLKLTPEQCIVFEDAANGIAAGEKAGMKVIALTTTHAQEELQGADLVIDSFTELVPEALFRKVPA